MLLKDVNMRNNKKSDGWLIRHMLSALTFDFSYDAKDFWWGADNPWNRNEMVAFRFLKIFITEFWAFFLQTLIPFSLANFVGSLNGGTWAVTTILYWWVGFLFCAAIFLSVLAWLRVDKGFYDKMN